MDFTVYKVSIMYVEYIAYSLELNINSYNVRNLHLCLVHLPVLRDDR